MKLTAPCPRIAPSAAQRAATLVELLAAMAVLSIFVYLLSRMLESSLGRFRHTADGRQLRGGLEAAIACLERDLEHQLRPRLAALPPLPQSASAAQREIFEGRLVLPFEVDRQLGQGAALPRSFPNAAPEFSSLAFVARLPKAGAGAESPAPALVGYYVAYARHSPLRGEDGSGMKLFRHFRPGGHPHGEGYADGMIRYVARSLHDPWSADPTSPEALAKAPSRPLVLMGNREIPFLMARRLSPDGFGWIEAAPAWPRYPSRPHLTVPPPSLSPRRGRAEEWEDPQSSVHDSLFPDEVICEHVVRFELHPWRRVRQADGRIVLMGARELNLHLGLDNGDEWPVLVRPDGIDLLLGILPEREARRLESYEAWLFPWSDEEFRTLPPPRQRIAQAARLVKKRLHLSPTGG